MTTIPVGVQLFSVRDEAKKDLAGTLKRVADMGYTGIELLQAFCEDVGDPDRMQAMLDDAGLACYGCHLLLPAFDAGNFERTASFFSALKAKHLTIPWIPLEKRNSRSALLELAETFHELAGKLAPYGLDLGYHNHLDEFLPLEEGSSETPWTFLFDHCCPEVMMQLDLGNALGSNADPDLPGIVRRYPGRSKVVHLKPYKMNADPDDPRAGFQFPIGQDSVPWNDVFAACETVGGTEWYVVEHGNGFDGIAECLKALKKMGKV